MFKILTDEEYPQYEAFVSIHKNAFFTQSIHWMKVKKNWNHEIVVSKDIQGTIKAAMLVLIRRLPMVRSTMLYAARGPVFDFDDVGSLNDLLEGAKLLAKKHRAFLFKMDPIIEQNDQHHIDLFKSLGMRFKPNEEYGATIQPRSNHILSNIYQKTDKEMLASFTQKGRYNIRIAIKNGVECKSGGIEAIDEFYRIFEETAKRDHFIIRDKSYYAGILKAMPKNARLYLCYYESKLVSGALYIKYAGRGFYLFGASSNDYRNVMPNYLMQWTMIHDTIAANCHTYDFMATPHPDDVDSERYGLYRFKKNFGGGNISYAGEFDYVFRPILYQCFKMATHAKRLISKLKKRAGKIR